MTQDTFDMIKEGGISGTTTYVAVDQLQSVATTIDYVALLSHPITYMILSMTIPFLIRFAGAQMKYYFDKKRSKAGLSVTSGTESKDPNSTNNLN